MSTIKLIGRTTDFKGKTLWEILGNLRNHGIGRLVQRNMFLRYPEPSFMKIVKVEALPNPTEVVFFSTLIIIVIICSITDFQGDRKVKVFVEKTFRGRTSPKLIEICGTSYKADYLLVPKDQEHTLHKTQTIEERILPRTIEFPPLLRELIKRETGQENPLLPVRIKANREKIARLANEGEVPNVSLSMGLGKPISPRLYKGLNVQQKLRQMQTK